MEKLTKKQHTSAELLIIANQIVAGGTQYQQLAPRDKARVLELVQRQLELNQLPSRAQESRNEITPARRLQTIASHPKQVQKTPGEIIKDNFVDLAKEVWRVLRTKSNDLPTWKPDISKPNPYANVRSTESSWTKMEREMDCNADYDPMGGYYTHEPW